MKTTLKTTTAILACLQLAIPVPGVAQQSGSEAAADAADACADPGSQQCLDATGRALEADQAGGSDGAEASTPQEGMSVDGEAAPMTGGMDDAAGTDAAGAPPVAAGSQDAATADSTDATGAADTPAPSGAVPAPAEPAVPGGDGAGDASQTDGGAAADDRTGTGDATAAPDGSTAAQASDPAPGEAGDAAPAPGDGDATGSGDVAAQGSAGGSEAGAGADPAAASEAADAAGADAPASDGASGSAQVPQAGTAPAIGQSTDAAPGSEAAVDAGNATGGAGTGTSDAAAGMAGDSTPSTPSDGGAGTDGSAATGGGDVATGAAPAGGEAATAASDQTGSDPAATDGTGGDAATATASPGDATEPRGASAEADAMAGGGASAAAMQDGAAPAEETSQTVTEENARSSDEDFSSAIDREAAPEREAEADGDDEGGLSDLEKALLLGAGALAVGTVLRGNREVVASSDDRVVVSGADGGYELLKDDNALLQRPGTEVSTQSYDDGSTRTVVNREDGSQIVTIRDASLRVLRRERITPDGQRVLLIDDTADVAPVDVSRLRAAEPVTAGTSDGEALRRALAAQGGFDRAYSLAQIRNIAEVRGQVPAIDLDSITFASGSAAISPTEAEELTALGGVIRDSIASDPNEIFLIEGHTDAVGDAAYNLALSDRRAESVALALTEYFEVPPENLVVQGYGERFLKIATEADERENRRATVRRITPLLQVAAAQ